MASIPRIRRGGAPARAAAALFLGAFLAGGCATNPVTGRSEVRFVSQAQEIELGREAYTRMRQAQGGDLEAFPAVEPYVSTVGQSLAAVSDRPELPYSFSVLNNEVPNAWTLPGGKIAVNRGLLVELENEAELAAVLSHEIVHAAARHGAKALERGMLLQAGVLGLGFAVDSHDYRDLLLGAAGATAQLVGMKYSRDAEREADYYGMKYMAEAGYDPAAAVTLQEKFVRLSKNRAPGWLEGLFASHPPSQERVEVNRRRLASLPPGGRIGAETYAEVVGPLKAAAPAYAKAEDGHRALEAGNPALALRLAEAAVAEVPEEASFHALAGRALAAQNRPAEALSRFNDALARQPDYFEYRLQAGLQELELGRGDAARQSLERSVELLPTAEALLGLGRIAMDRGDRDQAVEYFRPAATAESPAGREALRKLTRLDLPLHPQDYIQVRVARNADGYLVLEALNRSPLPVRDVGIEVAVHQDARTYRTIVGITEVIPAESAAQARTRVGPFASDQIVYEAVRVRIVQAKLAD